MAQEHALQNAAHMQFDSSAIAQANSSELILSDTGMDLTELRYGYTIGTLGFLIEKNLRSEVMSDPQIFPIPLAPAWFKGLTNTHGNIVPVYDLSTLLNTTLHRDKSRNYVLVLDKDDQAVGMMINNLPHALRRLESCESDRDTPAGIADYVSDRLQSSTDDLGHVWFEFDHKQFIEHLIKQT